jgi:cell wall-associated NlpC family hydrolase
MSGWVLPLAYEWMRSRVRVLAPVGALAAVAVLAGCGEAGVGASRRVSSTGTTASTQAASVRPADPPAAADPPATAGVAHEVADPLESSSYPAQGAVHHSSATSPAQAGEEVAAGAPSNAEVRQELEQMHAAERATLQTQQKQLTPVPGGESIGGNGTVPIPANVPEVVQKVIAGANAIADFPYVYGGGHASFVDNAYDCSGSVSYALAAGGLLSAPEVSGDLESWGVPGPGRYITVYAAAGHTYMYIDGMLFDTAGRSGPYASRWQVEPTDNAGYVVRHWPGL